MRLTANRDAGTQTNRPADSLPAPIAAIAIVVLLLVVGWLDYATGTAPFQHLYYLPIILASFLFDYWGGLTCALAAIVSYYLVNEHLRALNYGESDYLQVALFLSVGVIAAKLARDRRAMQRLAGTDDLTGLHNLRSFEPRLLATVRRAQMRRMPVAMLVLDVDRLKEINDSYGHLAGAEAVREVGQIITHRLDGVAVACRYGGDEFAVLLSDSDARSSFAFAESLRKAVEDHPSVLAGRKFPSGALTVSIGIALYLSDGPRDPELVGEELFHAADQALYEAKREGRNRVRLNGSTTTMPQGQDDLVFGCRTGSR